MCAYSSSDDSAVLSISLDGIHNDLGSSTGGLDDSSSVSPAPNQGVREPEITSEVPADLSFEEQADLGISMAMRRGRLVADHLIHGREFCLLSLDLEHGGEYCGILQLSVEMIRIRLKEGPGKDQLDDWARHTTTFNKYVNPGSNAIWDDALTAVHNLRRTHPRILEAKGIKTVW